MWKPWNGKTSGFSLFKPSVLEGDKPSILPNSIQCDLCDFPVASWVISYHQGPTASFPPAPVWNPKLQWRSRAVWAGRAIGPCGDEQPRQGDPNGGPGTNGVPRDAKSWPWNLMKSGFWWKELRISNRRSALISLMVESRDGDQTLHTYLQLGLWPVAVITESRKSPVHWSLKAKKRRSKWSLAVAWRRSIFEFSNSVSSTKRPLAAKGLFGLSATSMYQLVRAPQWPLSPECETWHFDCAKVGRSEAAVTHAGHGARNHPTLWNPKMKQSNTKPGFVCGEVFIIYMYIGRWDYLETDDSQDRVKETRVFHDAQF